MAITTTKELKIAYPVLCERLGKEARGETTVSIVAVIKNGQGRMSVWAEETRDLDDNLISKRIDKYTYYPTGEIDEIIQEEYKGKILISKKKLKHYRNGAQPDVFPIDVEIPKGL